MVGIDFDVNTIIFPKAEYVFQLTWIHIRIGEVNEFTFSAVHPIALGMFLK
jgi:hypothetical protein